jgi:hypothetical protein
MNGYTAHGVKEHQRGVAFAEFDVFEGGARYGHAVLGTLLGPTTGWATLAGVGAVALGLAVLLHRVFLAGADAHERKDARPDFWAALGVGTATVLGLLAAVNYFGLQAGKVVLISGGIGR